MHYTLKMHSKRDLTSRFALYNDSLTLLYSRNYTIPPASTELPDTLYTQTGVLLYRLSQVFDKVLTFLNPGDSLTLVTSSSKVHQLLWYEGYDDRYTKFIRERVLPKIGLSYASLEVVLDKRLKASHFSETRLVTEALDVPLTESFNLL